MLWRFIRLSHNVTMNACHNQSFFFGWAVYVTVCVCDRTLHPLAFPQAMSWSHSLTNMIPCSPTTMRKWWKDSERSARGRESRSGRRRLRRGRSMCGYWTNNTIYTHHLLIDVSLLSTLVSFAYVGSVKSGMKQAHPAVSLASLQRQTLTKTRSMRKRRGREVGVFRNFCTVTTCCFSLLLS